MNLAIIVHIVGACKILSKKNVRKVRRYSRPALSTGYDSWMVGPLLAVCRCGPRVASAPAYAASLTAAAKQSTTWTCKKRRPSSVLSP